MLEDCCLPRFEFRKAEESVRDRLAVVIGKFFTMSTQASVALKASTESEKPKEEKKKLKPCCACPETKKPRDQCIVERGEENCQDLIEAHKECMRRHGFNV